MARQRVRRIVVDGRTYGWRVRPIDESHVGLRFWRGAERVPMADVRVRFDDPWLRRPEMLLVSRSGPERFREVFTLDPITPARVAELIRACADRRPATERDLDLVDGELRARR